MIAEAVTSSLIAALLTTYPPVGCVIDCSSWHGKAATKNIIWMETLDGKAIKSYPEYPEDTDPSSPRLGYKLFLGNFGWEYEMIGEYRLFVRGSKAAPLHRVIIKPVEPGGWTPTYYFVWTYPPHPRGPSTAKLCLRVSDTDHRSLRVHMAFRSDCHLEEMIVHPDKMTRFIVQK